MKVSENKTQPKNIVFQIIHDTKNRVLKIFNYSFCLCFKYI